jgi:broad specificity phosphatase PhoE
VIAFVRHGQTEVNREGRLQGRIDARLSALGKEQARALATAFVPGAVARVFASPLARACSTAAEIAAAAGCDVEVDERLIELDYGAWDGVPLRDVPAGDWERWRADPSFTPPGGESLVAVTERVASFCSQWLSTPGVVAVSHVSPIKAAVCIALGADERASWRMQLSLASITRVDARDDGRAYLLSFNETAHLTPN